MLKAEGGAQVDRSAWSCCEGDPHRDQCMSLQPAARMSRSLPVSILQPGTGQIQWHAGGFGGVIRGVRWDECLTSCATHEVYDLKRL